MPERTLKDQRGSFFRLFQAGCSSGKAFGDTMIRSMQVARMAEAMGKVCTPHISGSGLGYLYMMHFVSALPNAGPFHEFKGFSRDIPLEGPGSSISSYNGMVLVPTGPGLCMTIDPDFVAKHQEVD